MSIADEEIQALVQELDRGRQAWINGRLEHTAAPGVVQDGDMTIFGPFGGDAARNGPGFEERQAGVASLFRGGSGWCELVKAIAEGDLLVLVLLERSTVTFAGHDQPQPWELRTTQVFRKEAGRWLRLHRHADPLIDRRSFEATLAIAAGAHAS